MQNKILNNKGIIEKKTLLPNGSVMFTSVKPYVCQDVDWFDKFANYWLSKTNSALSKTVS
jgi:hypothetical protein